MAAIKWTAAWLLAHAVELATAVDYPGLTWTICANSSSICAQQNVTFAYLYSYPFWPYALEVQSNDNATTNTLYHKRTLANASDHSIVKPNVDTLYSLVFLDLSSSDLVITIPDMDDRYWAWPFYDVYANDVANISPLQNFTGGEYLVRYNANNPGAWQSNASTSSANANVSDSYAGYVNLPTPYGISLIRILVQPDNGGAAAVNLLQDQFNITEVPRRAGSPSGAPRLDLGVFGDAAVVPGSRNSLEQGVLNLGALLAPYNPSEVVADRAWINETLVSAGFGPDGVFTPPAAAKNLTAASASANASVALEAARTGFYLALGEDWTIQNTTLIGNYFDAYVERYSVASGGYLALTPDQVLYPLYQGTYTATNTTAILITFSSKPPVATTLGFWSLTAYDSAGYLIDNPINVYSLGDRSNLTMLDGRSKYGDGSDGPFQILVQPGNVAPPANWTSNWLPSPADGAGFSMNLRFYGAGDAATDGSWAYPIAENVAAPTN